MTPSHRVTYAVALVVNLDVMAMGAIVATRASSPAILAIGILQAALSSMIVGLLILRLTQPTLPKPLP